MRKLIILSLLTLLSAVALAQSDRNYVRSGNRFYRQQNFAKAEAEYRKALNDNQNNTQAIYNLGCALMMQQKDSAAVVQFEKAGKMETSKLRRAKSYHNIGVICQNHRMYADAIKAYEESLRNNPNDDETRYNLALCKQQQKNNPQNNQNQNQNKQNQDKDKQNQDKQDKKKQDQQQQNQQQQQNKDRMSRDNAEQLLNAAMQEEQATQKRVKEKMSKSRTRHIDKNW